MLGHILTKVFVSTLGQIVSLHISSLLEVVDLGWSDLTSLRDLHAVDLGTLTETALQVQICRQLTFSTH